jgi:hypothetical protein
MDRDVSEKELVGAMFRVPAQRRDPRQTVLGQRCHLNSRAIVHSDDIRPGEDSSGPMVAFTCNGCGGQHRCDIEAPRKPKWTGLCSECRSERSNPTRRRDKDEDHSSGARLLWTQRDRSKPNWHRTVPFICRNGHRAEEEVTHTAAIDPDWKGLLAREHSELY